MKRVKLSPKGNEFQTRRQALGMTQREIAVRIGCSDMAVSLLEKGRLNTGTPLAQRLWQYLLDAER